MPAPLSGCFNAATTRRPWRTANRGWHPSWHPSFNAATTRRPWRTTLEDGAANAKNNASMRPQPEGRGERRREPGYFGHQRCFNAATTRRPWRTEAALGETGPPPLASMRPQPEGRGEQVCQIIRLFPCESLQCGHNPKAVENPGDGGPASQGRRRFNAATTRRPWRTTKKS